MVPRLGHIAFLNVLPLTYALAHGAAKGLDILRATPAQLNGRLEARHLDVSGVSSITYARHADDLLILPDVCIASDGDVRSVLLVSRVPAEQIGNARVLLSDKSASSHALLKIILRRAYDAAPTYETRALTPSDPVPEDAAAALFIGDDALELYHNPPAGICIYDLAREWKQLTGARMVFGIWAAARGFAEAHPDALRMVHGRIVRAFRDWDAVKAAAITEVLEDGRFTRAQLTEYLGRAVVWQLDEATLAGLRLFYRCAAEDGLIAHEPAIEMAHV
ncbi:MAG: menaquinone biosynthesis protein [Centipeda sp. (in: firmicutes)]|uniref:menaquinone biosynthesis protein n=1 Tax=Selenomonas sp. oral taxon 920 TaxID=1884263 RepID=UPI000840DAF5|nr:menaquinone biosynthesis protein [Selenomonas sp. oral taxon 920]AOH46995.1 solute-binding protein [Selenomonas sp. oral taxon 920]